MTKMWMAVNRRTLMYSFITSVVLFAIALPLGDDQHGIGKDHPVVADIGNAVFAVFLVSAVVLIALVVLFLIKSMFTSHRSIHT